MSWPSTFPG